MFSLVKQSKYRVATNTILDCSPTFVCRNSFSSKSLGEQNKPFENKFLCLEKTDYGKLAHTATSHRDKTLNSYQIRTMDGLQSTYSFCLNTMRKNCKVGVRLEKTPYENLLFWLSSPLATWGRMRVNAHTKRFVQLDMRKDKEDAREFFRFLIESM